MNLLRKLLIYTPMTTRTILKPSEKVLEKIFEQVSMLRKEVSLLLPHEDIENFAHANRIKQSYRHAIKEHPPIPE